uniref:Uncharacterized protein n=1 Tax=Rhizophagus irregularis (strain DAOM 181602 / DAOM 197198 / MUCL 43194) TaxID=747089 RepID=U9TZ55_RHIID
MTKSKLQDTREGINTAKWNEKYKFIGKSEEKERKSLAFQNCQNSNKDSFTFTLKKALSLHHFIHLDFLINSQSYYRNCLIALQGTYRKNLLQARLMLKNSVNLQLTYHKVVCLPL